MKKILLALFAMLMCLSLFACGTENKEAADETVKHPAMIHQKSARIENGPVRILEFSYC